MKKYGMCRVDKVVMINVYVLKPRRRRSSTSSDHHHHDPQFHDWPKHNGSIGYNRKPPISPTTTSNSKNPQAQLPIVMRSHKPQNERPTSGFGNWKLMLHPGSAQKSIFSSREKKEKKKKRSQSISNRINAMTKDFRVKKKPGFMKKFLSIFQKR